jgi:hypothetical protein
MLVCVLKVFDELGVRKFVELMVCEGLIFGNGGWVI